MIPNKQQFKYLVTMGNGLKLFGKKVVNIVLGNITISAYLYVVLKLEPCTFCSEKVDKSLGKPSCKKSAVFFNIVQKAFDPPPLLFEHLSYFAGGVF